MKIGDKVREQNAVQAQRIVHAIQAAIVKSGQEIRDAGDPPTMNALLDALALHVALAFAAIDSRKARRIMRDEFDRAVRYHMARPDVDETPKAKTILYRGGDRLQ